MTNGHHTTILRYVHALFDVGSSREDVIAAQGSPPTYSGHPGRTLWWASSRVEFDDAGRGERVSRTVTRTAVATARTPTTATATNGQRGR